MLYVCVCVSVCLATLVYCGHTVGWIKMSLGTEVGIGLGDIVLYVDPAPSTTERDKVRYAVSTIFLFLVWAYSAS